MPIECTHSGKHCWPPGGLAVSVVALLAMVGCNARSVDEQQAALSVPVQGAELDLRVGSIDDPTYALTFFLGMEVDRRGRMYTLHPTEQVIRVFGADGGFERTIGSPGAGPGEFGTLRNLGWVADSDTLWVLDGNGFRFSHFSQEGEYLGSFSVPFATTGDPSEVQPPRAAGLLTDRTVYGLPPASALQIQVGTLTHYRIMRLDREGSVLDTIASVPVGRNQWAISVNPDDPDAGGHYRLQPFADGGLWSLVPNEPAVVQLDRTVGGREDGSAFQLTKVSLSGDTLFSRSYFTESVRILESEVDSMLAAVTEEFLGMGSGRRFAPGRARTWLEHDFHRPPVRPAVTNLVVGKTGEIWLKEPASQGDPLWLRLSPEGEPISRVSLPDNLTVLAANAEYVWGSETDALDVPYLVRYRIQGEGETTPTS